MSLDSDKPAGDTRLALPMLYDDVLFLYVFFNNLELQFQAKANTFVRMEAIRAKFDELERLGVIRRIDRLIVSAAPY